MLSLGNQYTGATTEAQRAVFLAAGHVMLVNWQGTAFDVSYILGSASTVIVSVTMLRSHRLFSRAAAYFGIAAGVLMFVPPTAGPIGLTMSVISVMAAAVCSALQIQSYGHVPAVGLQSRFLFQTVLNASKNLVTEDYSLYYHIHIHHN